MLKFTSDIYKYIKLTKVCLVQSSLTNLNRIHVFSCHAQPPFGMSRNAVEGTMRILHECAWIRILPLNNDGGFLIPFYSGPSGVTRRQFLVNILLDVMVQDTGFTVKFTKNFMNLRFVQTNLPFFFLIKLFLHRKFAFFFVLQYCLLQIQPSQVGSLFTFLARQMAKHENRIQVNKVLFEQVGLSFVYKSVFIV